MLLGLISRPRDRFEHVFQRESLAFDLPANLLMLQGLGIGTNLNGPSWSISTEFAAYFLFPLFIVGLSSIKSAHRFGCHSIMAA